MKIFVASISFYLHFSNFHIIMYIMRKSNGYSYS